MKVLDRFNLILFSMIVFVISLVICLLTFKWVDLEWINEGLKFITVDAIANKVTLGISIVLILLSLKSIFFNSYSKEKLKEKDGILLENDNGKLLVSKDTIESLTNAVVKSFNSAETVMTKVEIDEESKIRIFITLFVHPDAVIKELSNKLQTNVKDAIKKSLDLDVAEVNVRVKNISVKKEPTIKE